MKLTPQTDQTTKKYPKRSNYSELKRQLMAIAICGGMTITGSAYSDTTHSFVEPEHDFPGIEHPIKIAGGKMLPEDMQLLHQRIKKEEARKKAIEEVKKAEEVQKKSDPQSNQENKIKKPPKMMGDIMIDTGEH